MLKLSSSQHMHWGCALCMVTPKQEGSLISVLSSCTFVFYVIFWSCCALPLLLHLLKVPETAVVPATAVSALQRRGPWR